MKINRLDLVHLRNDLYFQFHTEVREAVEKGKSETLSQSKIRNKKRKP